MKNERILNALGKINDDMIADAKIGAQAKKTTPQWVRWAAMAACLCLLIAAGSVIIPLLQNGGNWNAEKPQKVYLVGAVFQTGDGTLTYHTDNFDEHVLAFTMVLNHDIPYSYVAFNGYNILEEWIDEDGVLHQETEMFKAITPCDYYESGMEYTVIDDVLKIMVNGEEVNAMPCTEGTYEIIIDYSELYKRMDVVNTSVELCPGGEIIIDSERFLEGLIEAEQEWSGNN